MATQFTAKSIINTTGGRLVSGDISDADASGSITTRLADLKPGEWFLALPETEIDTHDHLAEAVKKGALGCIVVDRRRYPFASEDSTLIAVDSTIHAYYQLARLARLQISPKVIAITGSSGKSTTRNMLASILSISADVHSEVTKRSDARSLAQSILGMPETTDALIVELSQKGRGYISWLGSSLDPDIAVITNIDLAHLEFLGSIENIAAAKCELLETLSIEDGLAILGDKNDTLLRRAELVYKNGRKHILDDSDLEEVAVTTEHTVFSVSGSDTLYQVKAHGAGYLKDAWCAIMCARELGLTDPTIAEGLRRYQPPQGRGNKVTGVNGSLIIDESHSATPGSVRASITAFLDKRAIPHKCKYLVIGEMKELGEASDQIHTDIGMWLSNSSLNGLLTIGDAAESVARGAYGSKFKIHKCKSPTEAYDLLQPKLNEATSVLVEGSDSFELRSLVSLLSGNLLESGSS